MNLTEDLFSKERFSKEEVNHIVTYLQDHPDRLFDFYEILKSDNDYTVFQASWILLNASKKKNLRSTFQEFLPQIYPLLKTTQNTSLLRNRQRYFIETGIPVELKDDLIDFCFKILDNKFNEVSILNNAFLIIEMHLKRNPELIQPLYEATYIIKDRQPTSFHSKFRKFTTKFGKDIRTIN